MALIQDIQPSRPGQVGAHHQTSSVQFVQKRIRQVHQATNIPQLAQRSAQRVSSFDILPQGSRRESRLSRASPRTPVTQVTRSAKPAAVPILRFPRSISKPVASSTGLHPLKDAYRTPKTDVSRAKPRLGRRLADFAQYPLIASVAIGAAYSPTVGQYLILAFAILSLVLRISSRYSFGTALLLLASIPFFQVLKLSGVSQNAAIYAFELLVAGTFLACVELHRDRNDTSSLHA